MRTNLTKEVYHNFQNKLAIGESRSAGKLDGTANSKIYSWNTYNTYYREAQHFTNYCKEKYNCKTLDECEKHVKDYLDHKRIDDKVSAYTQKTELSAIGKLYGKSYFKEVETDSRERVNIIRGRDMASESFRHFSESKNAELVNFCKETGLRRRELETLKGKSVIEKDGKYYVHVSNGKGGRERDVYILNQDKAVIDKINNTPADQKVWGNVHGHANIHGYRSDYATAYYNSIARDLSTISSNEIYCCRDDKAGIHYDKEAMKEVSESLGHSRIEVIAGHYLN